MGNIVENNNSLVDFSQVWSNYVFVDQLPEECPELSTATSSRTIKNEDGTFCELFYFQKESDNSTYDYLIYFSNLQLIKEFRQGRAWKLVFEGTEEAIRRLVLPGTTISRNYTPEFSDERRELPYTSVDPKFDLRDCRINVGLPFNKLYLSGWLYIGKTLYDISENILPPFDDSLWLLKNKKTGNRAKFSVREENNYILPPSKVNEMEPHMIVTTDIFNTVANSIGILDEGVCW